MSLPAGFVYFEDIWPDHHAHLRYGTSENVMRMALPGYAANRVILSHKAAEALAKAASLLDEKGYRLVIYDAYRPQQAVDALVAWSTMPDDPVSKQYYYPYIEKALLFNGYISKTSAHTRGSAVDVTIIEKSNVFQDPPRITERAVNSSKPITFLDDNTVDMGGSFDLLDSLSHTAEVPEPYLSRRLFLKAIMESAGLMNYHREWWHFSLPRQDEPFPDSYFTFDVA